MGVSANSVRLRSLMKKLDALWAEAEVLAHDLKDADGDEEKEQGIALLDLVGGIQESCLQSGLTDLDD